MILRVNKVPLPVKPNSPFFDVVYFHPAHEQTGSHASLYETVISRLNIDYTKPDMTRKELTLACTVKDEPIRLVPEDSVIYFSDDTIGYLKGPYVEKLLAKKTNAGKEDHVLQNMDLKLDLTYLTPKYLQSATVIDTEIDVQLLDSDYEVVLLIDTLIWMVNRHLHESKLINSLVYPKADCLVVVFELDDFLINNFFDSLEKDHIEEVVEKALNILSLLNWSGFSFQIECLSDDPELSKIKDEQGAKVDLLEEDPVISVVINFFLEVSEKHHVFSPDVRKLH